MPAHTVNTIHIFSAGQGLEPRLHGPKPCVLPLDDPAIKIQNPKLKANNKQILHYKTDFVNRLVQ